MIPGSLPCRLQRVPNFFKPGTNVITPAQNLANTERDLRQAVEHLLKADAGIDDGRLKLSLEMVARAYDPCISCSVHVTRLDGS